MTLLYSWLLKMYQMYSLLMPVHKHFHTKPDMWHVVVAVITKVKFNDNNVTVVVTVVTYDEGNKHFQAPEGYKMFPMDLDGITNPAEYGYDRDLIKSWKVGEKKRISYMVPVKEDMYNPIIAPINCQ